MILHKQRLRQGIVPAVVHTMVFLAALVPGCASKLDYSPMTQETSGLTQIAWHDRFPSVRMHLEEIPGVAFVDDSLITISEEPLFLSADSVIPPRLGNLKYTRSNFSGGTFFGRPVAWWYAWFSDEGFLRNIEVLFEKTTAPDEAFAAVGEQLMIVYGSPDVSTPVYQEYSLRGWTERSEGGEFPGTGVLLTWVRYEGVLSLGFHEFAYADSLNGVPLPEAVSMNEWKKSHAGAPDQ